MHASVHAWLRAGEQVGRRAGKCACMCFYLYHLLACFVLVCMRQYFVILCVCVCVSMCIRAYVRASVHMACCLVSSYASIEQILSESILASIS